MSDTGVRFYGAIAVDDALAAVDTVKAAIREAVGISYEDSNAPCISCGHSRLAHNVGDTSPGGRKPGGQCMWCAPKGSSHHYTNKVEVQGTRITESSSRWSADEVDESLVHLAESIFPSMDVQHLTVVQDSMEGKRKGAMLYNAHSLAAHRSSLAAYSTGNEAAHQVAAAHHQMAADCAEGCAKDYDSKEKTGQAFTTAAKYHRDQARAHKSAAKNAAVGNSEDRYSATSGMGGSY